MANSNDPRITNQYKFLYGKSLVQKAFVCKGNWDHEHCAFCWDRFSEYEGDLHEGYVTADDKYTWICSECFEDFKEMFQWELVDPEENM